MVRRDGEPRRCCPFVPSASGDSRQGVAVSNKGDKPKAQRGRKPKLRLVSNNAAPASHEADAPLAPLMKGNAKNKHGVTAKQERFAFEVAQGSTLAAAYRAAYDAANMSQHAIHNEACKLMANPDVAARVDALVREKQAKASHDAARIRAHVIERLHAESTDPDNPPAARVRALELLGKLDVVGAFRERVSNEAPEPAPADLEATLRARLQALIGKAS